MFLIIGFIALVSVATSYYFMQKDRSRREQRHEKMREKQQELLGRLSSEKNENEQDIN
jgi:hypothetical protein